MNLYSQTYSGRAIPFPLAYDTGGIWQIGAINVDNQTGATLTILSPGGQALAVVPTYSPRSFIVPDWTGFQIKSDGTALIASDFVNVQATDRETIQSLPPFVLSAVAPPRGWGSGTSANTLRSVAPGDAFLTWQINQMIDLLTGVMTGQANVRISAPVRIDKELFLPGQFAGGQFTQIHMGRQDGGTGDFYCYFADNGGVLFRLNDQQGSGVAFPLILDAAGVVPQIGFLGASPTTRPNVTGTPIYNSSQSSELSALTALGLTTNNQDTSRDRLQTQQWSVANNAISILLSPNAGLQSGLNPLGWLFITSQEDSQGALFYLRGQAAGTTKVLDPSADFSPTAGNAGTTNIYWSPADVRYEIENKTGGSRNYSIFYIGRN